MEQLTLSAKALESQKTEINSIAAISICTGTLETGEGCGFLSVLFLDAKAYN